MEFGAASDETLMTSAARGSLDAYEVLVRRYHPRLLQYSRKLLGNLDGAEDVAQEVLTQLWRKRQSYQARSPFIVFLLTLARNACRNMERSHNRRSLRLVSQEEGLSPEVAQSGPELIDRLVQRQEEEQMKAAVAQLSDDQREVLLLRFHENLDFKTIGNIVGKNESTVRSQAFYGLRALKALLTETP